MRPIERARQWYEEHGMLDQFAMVCMTALRYGVLYADDDVFVAAVPARKEEKRKEKVKALPVEEADCWYVMQAAGKWTKLFDMATVKFPWVMFRRNGGQRRVYAMERLKQKSGG